jgi:hypothetical protein
MSALYVLVVELVLQSVLVIDFVFLSAVVVDFGFACVLGFYLCWY